RIHSGACSLGAAWSALDKARQYMVERKAFGRQIADFQALQFKIADMATELEAARLMIYRAADALDRADPQASMYSAMGKRMATDLGFKVCNEALQIHGGYGYLRDYGLEKLVRDLRVHQILEGTNEIMRVVISRKVLGGNRGGGTSARQTIRSRAVRLAASANLFCLASPGRYFRADATGNAPGRCRFRPAVRDLGSLAVGSGLRPLDLALGAAAAATAPRLAAACGIRGGLDHRISPADGGC